MLVWQKLTDPSSREDTNFHSVGNESQVIEDGADSSGHALPLTSVCLVQSILIFPTSREKRFVVLNVLCVVNL